MDQSTNAAKKNGFNGIGTDLSDKDEIMRLVAEQVERERQEYAPLEDAVSSFSSKEIMDAIQNNEDGDARIYIELHRGKFCYETAAGVWYRWSGHFWTEDLLNDALQSVNAVVDVYAHQLERLDWELQKRLAMDKEKVGKNEQFRKNIWKRIFTLQSLKKKKQVLELARTGENTLAMDGRDWDKAPGKIPVQNGIVDLATGKLEPGKPEHLIKTVAPTKFLSLVAPAPTWERFVSEIFNGNQELIAYVQRLLGYAITGLAILHIILILWGPRGRNGKGVMLETLKYILGDLAYKTRSEVLLESRFSPARGAPDADTLAFRGKRIIWASETDEGRALNVSRIKELCGGDTLNARAPYGHRTVEFSPTHTLFLLTNNRPKAPGHDDAFWERVHLIPFNVRFVDDPSGSNERKVDYHLREKLKEEAPGILAWLVKGCLAWQKEEGLNPPACVKDSTSEYRCSEDDIRHFIDEKILGHGVSEISTSELYGEYRQWHTDVGMAGQPLSMKALSNRLVDMGFERGGTKRKVLFNFPVAEE